MRVFLFLMAIITSSVIGVFSQTSTQKRYTIRYEEKVRPGDASFENQKLPAKIRRSSSNKGEINFIYYDEFPDSMKVALSAAASLWEAKISNKYPIYIGVFYDSLAPDVAIAADVIHYDYSQGASDTYGCPSSLLSQISNHQYGNKDYPDGYIYFNNNVDWNCNFSDNCSSGYNTTTMALIGIARCLGFGTSVTELKNNEFYFSFLNPSYFDKLLYRNSICLSELTDGSQEIADFVKSDNVYLHTPSNIYKIYAPKLYKSNVSLCYLDEDNSLMSYSLGKGNCVLSIDEKTFDILRTIGWNLPATGLGIKCFDIQDNGIGSSYKSHSFHLDTDNDDITNYRWRFYLKDKSKKYIEISTGNTAEFTIDKIASEKDYFININGDLEGKIECSYTLNGEECNAIPFTVSLELKPVINSVNLNVTNLSDYSFYLTFIINYTGADNVFVEIEEEFDSTLRSYRIDEPFIAHAKTGKISTLYYSWVTVEVSNQYGSAYETWEFEPDYNLNKQMAELDNISDKVMIINNIQIFNLNGTIIFDGSPNNFSEDRLSQGVYLKKEIYDNGTVKTSKQVIL